MDVCAWATCMLLVCLHALPFQHAWLFMSDFRTLEGGQI
jgi:hypothetical protein